MDQVRPHLQFHGQRLGKVTLGMKDQDSTFAYLGILPHLETKASLLDIFIYGEDQIK